MTDPTKTMTASTRVKAVMVMVSGHGRKILVVVEDGLGVFIMNIVWLKKMMVLILVVVEDGHGD